ncbi:serine/threonine protein kinase [Streptacidiphilus pinicola]|uniref:non-specific serine/threonine protein kinase n=1 Tax=Streptacidiphilus pinicola TaxID=2219663 RepID=A0A2X0K6W7_9ACTN|nr:serine/threonine-protein kinase [Streptacidiphilus pinicola]RAG83269.1 serine/threonine protein kinase [Streptacidiphilus pinicola]
MEWIVPGYRHTRELGAGGSGRVVLALHQETGTPVAIKYLGEELRDDPDFLTEFREEARLLGDLDSAYVVRLYEYVEGPEGAAIVMELVDGIALRALLRQAGATGPEAALVVLRGSLLGLAAAHALGVVHRDYKPENVLVAADGSSKLVDFGIAVKSGDEGGIAGTPPYMAPEQWTGDPASPAADVYAATATFFECLTGSRPYPGTTFAELVVQHTTAPIPDELAPEAVRPLIRRGLAKHAAERPESAAAFVTELESIAGAAYGPQWEERGRRRLAAMAALLPLLFPSAGGGGATSGTTALASTALSTGRPVRRPVVRGGRPVRRIPRKILVGVGGGIVLVGVAGGVALAGANNNPPKATGGPTPVAVTSISPSASGSGTTSASASPSSSPTSSPSPSASASASASPSTSPSASPTTAQPTTAPPTTAPPTSPSPTPTPLQVSKLSDVWGYNGSTLAQVIYGYATTNTTGSFTMSATWFYYTVSGGEQVFSQSTRPLSGSTSYGRVRFDSGTPPQGNCLTYGVHLTTNPAAANGTVTETWKGTCIG